MALKQEPDGDTPDNSDRCSAWNLMSNRRHTAASKIEKFKQARLGCRCHHQQGGLQTTAAAAIAMTAWTISSVSCGCSRSAEQRSCAARNRSAVDSDGRRSLYRHDELHDAGCLARTVGDGETKTLDHGGGTTVATRIGKKPNESTLTRFFVGRRPIDQEITGMWESPDGKVMFINVQHPGDTTTAATIGDPSKFTKTLARQRWVRRWRYGTAQPRCATVMITKNDGGRIGS